MAKTGATQKQLSDYGKNTGVCRFIQNHLVGLEPLIPDPYGMFGPDVLHSLALGWAPKMNNILDGFSHKFMRATGDIKNIADARDRVDRRLVLMPTFVGLLRFNSGWWESDNLNGTSGAENLSLLWQLPFVFVQDSLLIPDPVKRKRILALHWSVALLARELKTPQWYRECDLDDLRMRLHKMADEFRWVMLLLDHDYIPGDGMNIPKFHDLMSAALHIIMFGCLMNGDTGVFERMMKHIKRHDVLVGRSRANDGSVDVFTTASAAEFDGVVEATEELEGDDDDNFGIEVAGIYAGAHVDLRTRSGYALGQHLAVDDDLAWRLQLANLSTGLHGPAVHPDKVREFCTSMNTRTFVTYAPQCKYTLRDRHGGEHSVRILKPGHCVQLSIEGISDDDSTSFAQILCINVQQRTRLVSGHGPLLAVCMFDFLDIHPELAEVPHLRRGKIAFVHLSDVHRRAHIVPLYRGGHDDTPCEPFPTHFLVNIAMFPRYIAPSATRIFMSCKCGVPLPKPPCYGDPVTCPKCTRATPWL